MASALPHPRVSANVGQLPYESVHAPVSPAAASVGGMSFPAASVPLFALS